MSNLFHIPLVKDTKYNYYSSFLSFIKQFSIKCYRLIWF